ncbi:MAG: hypothetical protein LBJ00_14835 [Planctomycetaceae bacterium]|nr:hypothetical protein [Planctomycetaceae bacterium]
MEVHSSCFKFPEAEHNNRNNTKRLPKNIHFVLSVYGKICANCWYFKRERFKNFIIKSEPNYLPHVERSPLRMLVFGGFGENV